jgi:hypothetical protein
MAGLDGLDNFGVRSIPSFFYYTFMPLASKPATLMAMIGSIAYLVCSFVALQAYGGKVVFAQEAKPVSQKEITTSSVAVNLRLLRVLAEGWEFEITTQNSGNHAVFIMTEAVRSDGSRGTYLTLNAEDPSILEMGIQLYPIPGYCIYANQTRVTLKRLDPGTSYIERMMVPFSARETSPPNKGLEHQPLDKSKLHAARAAVGILPDDEGIQDFLRRKQGIGSYAGGLELISKGPLKGKSLYEVQKIIRSATIKF